MNYPRISVVMSVFNGERYLKEAIESILAQTFKDFEFIIIDDGSVDRSLEILRDYERKDIRMKVISRENRGLISSLNEGVSIAKGEYIARMDADDISAPDRLERQLGFIEKNKLVLCGTWADVINNLGNKIGEMKYPPDSHKIKSYSLLHNPFIHPSVIFRKDVFIRVGSYRSIFKHIEDYELWTRIIFKYRSDNIPEKLLLYRVHDKQITQKNNLMMSINGLLVRMLALYYYPFSRNDI